MLRSLILVSMIVLLLGLPFPASAGVGVLSEHLRFLEPLIGQEWVGHYTDEEAAHFIQELRWESICGGHVVRLSKEVEELDFTMETLYYWNADSSHVAYVTVTNRGQVSTGTVAALGDTIELLGQDLTAEGQMAYRYTFCIVGDGVLEDRFYRPTGDGWEERHLIRYELRSSTESAEPAN